MIEVFGWVAAAIGMASFFPQLIRIIRARTAAGVSLRNWQFLVGTQGAWCAHGFLVGVVQMQWPNLVMVLTALAIVVFIRKERGRPVLPALVVPLLIIAALYAIDVFVGGAAFGLIVAIPQVGGQMAQLREILRSTDLSGISPGYLSINLLVNAMWTVFGFVTVEWALMVCATAMTVICSINLITYLTRRRRAGRVISDATAVPASL